MFLGILAAIALSVGITETAIELQQADSLAAQDSGPVLALAAEPAPEWSE